jgi:hypothetical protein
LAGIWWEDAAYALCWRRSSDKGETFKKLDCYMAPSWSWASVIGSVNFPRPSDSSLDVFPLRLIAFKDYGVDYRGYNNFGQVNSGWMRVEAPLASFASMNPIEARYARISDSFEISGIQYTEVDAIAGFDFDEQESEDLRLLFLLQMEWDTDAISHRDGVELFGIVIRLEKELSPEICEDIPLQVKNNQIYKRAGFFYIENWGKYYERVLVLEQLVTEVVLI